MALTTINLAKESSESHQPLLLATFTFPDASILRLSSHPLNTADGGYQYGGNDYFPRIVRWSIGAIQAVAEQGISVVPRLELGLADPDKYLWTNYEQASGKGFKGATLELTFVFQDADTATFSSDSAEKFAGICSGPRVDDKMLSVIAENKLNLQKRFLPTVPIQRRCPWVFPTTAAQRQAGADNEDSKFYRCGYSQDSTGTNARGNLNGALPYTDCGYTKADCVARGMYIQDGSSRITGRFGGIQWDPPAGQRSREYVSGQWLDVKNNPSEAKYGDYIALVYGAAWVDATVMNVLGGGNSTRGEAVVCVGEVQNIQRVAVGSTELPPATDMLHNAYIVPDPLMAWYLINRGDRDGGPNALPGYTDKLGNPLGDPYGSLAAFVWVFPRKDAAPGSAPRVRALIQGPRIRIYTTLSAYTKAFGDNPAWVLMDLLIQVGFEYADLDIQSFLDAASFAGTGISYTDQNGNSSTHSRFLTSLVIKQRRSAADVVNGLLRSFNAILVPNNGTGKLEVHIKQTLADQQGSAVAGSNYNTAVSSKTAAGVVTNGYAAYKFGGSTIARAKDGRSTLKLWTRPNNDAPNRVNFTFANADRDYAGDSASIIDETAIGRIDQEVVKGLQVDGVPNVDQANRIGNTIIAEAWRGNASGDRRGTYIGELEPLAGFRVIRLRVGHICLLTDVQHGITNQLIRVLKIQPGANFETCKVTFQFHDDDWYTDVFWQSNDPLFSEQARDRLPRPSFPWCPYKVQPNAADPMFDATDWNFGLEQQYEDAADGTAIAKLLVTGRQPVNIFAALTPPQIAIQGTTATTGGSLAGSGRTYFISVCAKDSDGKLSPPPPRPAAVTITDAGATNKATVTVPGWDSSAVGHVVLAGLSPSRLTFQSEAATTPATVDLTAYNERAWGMPDVEFDRLVTRMKLVSIPGAWSGIVTAVGSGSIQVTGAGWTINGWAGRDVSLAGEVSGGSVALYNAAISSNTADTLSVSPNPVGTVAVGDAIVIRCKPTAQGSNYVEDSQLSLGTNAEVGKLLRIVAGVGRIDTPYRIASHTATRITVDRPFDTTPDSTTRFIVEEPEWQTENITDALDNSDPSAELTVTAEVSNYLDQHVLVEVGTMDAGGNESLPSLAPIREIYIFGGAGIFGVSLPGKITGLTLDAVDYTDPNKAHITGSATLPASFNDFNGCEVFIVVDPAGTPSDPVAVGHQYHDPTDTVGPFTFDLRIPRPSSAESWRLEFVQRNATKSADLVLAAGPNQTPYADVTITARPSSSMALPGQMTGLVATLNAYGVEATTRKPVADMRATWVEPADADDKTIHSIWMLKTSTSVGTAPDSAAFEAEANLRYSPTQHYVDIWVDRPAKGAATERYWMRGVTSDEGSGYTAPTNTSPAAYVDVTAPVAPAQVTGFYVSVVDKSTGVDAKTFRINYTRPSDADFFVALIERISLVSAGGAPVTGAVWSYVTGVGSWATAGVATSEDRAQFPLPPTAEYWQFRARSQSRAGLENDIAVPTTYVTVPADTGLDMGKADISTLDAELGVTGGKLLINVTNLAKATNFNTSEFQLGAGPVLEQKAVNAQKMTLGSWLKVGAAGGMPGQILIVDALGNTVVWAGSNGGYVGLSAKALWAGGDGTPPNAPFSVDGSGNVVMKTAGGYQPSVNITNGSRILKIDATNGVWIEGAIRRAILNDGQLLVDNKTYPNQSGIVTDTGVLFDDMWGGTVAEMYNRVSPPGYGIGRMNLYNAGLVNFQADGNPGYADAKDSFRIGGVTVINSSKQFVGNGVVCPLYGVQAAGFNPYVSGVPYYGVTSATFTTVDGKTVTVKGGAITSVV